MTLKDDTLLNDLPDKDLNPENADSSPISGTAMLVSPMSGFSSSYNAVALTDCDIMPADLVFDDADDEDTLGVQLSTGVAGTADDDMDGDGCWTTTMVDPIAATAEDAGIRTNPAMNGILYALQGMTTDPDAAANPAILGSDTMNDRDILTVGGQPSWMTMSCHTPRSC